MRLILILIYIGFYAVCENNHPLQQKLSTWHVLKENDIHLHRNKRSLDKEGEINPVDKQISFNVFDQTIILSLLVSPDILAPEFKAYKHGKSGSSEIIVDKSTLMKGTVMGDPHSSVIAHYDGKMLSANIRTKNETYVVEPMWRHMPQNAKAAENTTDVPKLEHSDMIVYRLSDVDFTGLRDPHGKNGFCQSEKLMESTRGQQQQRNNFNKTTSEASITNSVTHRRIKRSTSSPTKKICKLSLVADHRFYRYMGNNSTLETMYYLISLIERVNAIYKNTNWDSELKSDIYTGYGFQINNISVYTESSNEPRYNQARDWKIEDLLKAFSENNYSVCLSHLFTYIDFSNGVLGLAHVALEDINYPGGICSYLDYSQYNNSGLTTAINRGQRILTTEADLVTAHELGHNFGAVHDDDTRFFDNQSCTPGQAQGGNYLMYSYAVSGQYANNKKFSDCSKLKILDVLLNKASLCFQEYSKTFCGNYKVEPDNNETCDVGLFATDDPCCQSNCQLKPGAICSNKNYPCCTDNCQVADSKKLCHAHIQGLCFKNTYCNGVDKTCPAEEPVEDGLDCGDEGKCKNGTCQQFCTTKGLRPCLCTEKEYQCKRCCASVNSTGKIDDFDCRPFLNETTGEFNKLKENATCIYGYCNEDECTKHTQDVIEIFWGLFKHITSNNFGKFLADNIVGAVLLFSLLFWIPCSCLINFVDKKRLLERQKEEKWLTERGADFTRSFGGFRSVASGSAPNTPRLRVSLNNTNRISGGIAQGSGFEPRELCRISQEKELFKQYRENVSETLSAVPGSLNEEAGFLSHSQQSPVIESNSNNGHFLLTGPSVSSLQPSLASLSPKLNDHSLGKGMKPIAVSSNANLLSLDESECSIRDDISAVQYRRNLKNNRVASSSN